MYNIHTGKEVCCQCGSEIEDYEDYEVIGFSTYCESCTTYSDNAQDSRDNSSCYSVATTPKEK